MFAKVANGVTKSCQIFRRKKGKITRNFGLIFFTFLAGSLVVRESRHRRDRISDKNAEKEEEENFGSEICFSKVGESIPFSAGNFPYLFAAEKLTSCVWGGITSKLASQ